MPFLINTMGKIWWNEICRKCTPKRWKSHFWKSLFQNFPGKNTIGPPNYSRLRAVVNQLPISYLFSAVPEPCDKLASCPVGLDNSTRCFMRQKTGQASALFNSVQFFSLHFLSIFSLMLSYRLVVYSINDWIHIKVWVWQRSELFSSLVSHHNTSYV